MNKQKGFTLIEGLLIVLIISAISIAGVYVYNNQTSDSVENSEKNIVVNQNPEDKIENINEKDSLADISETEAIDPTEADKTIIGSDIDLSSYENAYLFFNEDFPAAFLYPSGIDTLKSSCVDNGEGYKFTTVQFAIETETAPDCRQPKLSKDVRFLISSYQGYGYDAGYIDSLSENREYYTDITKSTKTINNVEFTKIITNWSGFGGIIEEGTITTTYVYQDLENDLVIEAVYWSRPGQTDEEEIFNYVSEAINLNEDYDYSI